MFGLHPELQAPFQKRFDRVVRGASIIFDDYGWLTFAKQKAVADSFLSERGHRILELPTGQGQLVKR